MTHQDIVINSLHFDCISSILKSRKSQLINYARSEIKKHINSKIFGLWKNQLFLIKYSDAILGLLGSLNYKNNDNIQLLNIFNENLAYFSQELLPFLFLPSFQYYYPQPLTEHTDKLTFTKNIPLYIEIQKLLFSQPFTKLFSCKKLWVLASLTTDFDKITHYEINQSQILSLFRQQYQEHNKLNFKFKRMQFLQNEFLQTHPYAFQQQTLPQDINPELINLLDDLYKSDSLKLFDSFSGPLFCSQKPKENLSLYNTLGSGFLQNCAISDCIVEATLLQSIILKLLKLLCEITDTSALLVKRLTFQLFMGQIFSSKLALNTLFSLPFNIVQDLRFYSGFEIYKVLFHLNLTFPKCSRLIENLQIFPNKFDVYAENYKMSDVFNIGKGNVQLLSKLISYGNLKQKRNFYAEFMMDIEKEKFAVVLDKYMETD